MSAEYVASQDALIGTPKSGDVVHDKYRVERVLGVGGMGVVLEAWHLQLHQKVALKVLQPALGADPEALGRFEREARAVVKLKSEHSTRVLDVGRLHNNTPFIVMEYLEGHDLSQVLKRGIPMPVEEAVAYILQACEVVAEAHGAGIVHRDLKPENLFLTKRNDGTACIKVLDFGLSKVRRPDGSDSRPGRALTAYRQAMGTPNYMSPEQWMSARDVGPASDQWALATIVYELLTGVPAFGGKEIGQVCSKVLNKEPKSLTDFRSDVEPALEVAIRRALKKDPNARYPTLYEFALAIGDFGSELSSVSVERVAGIFHMSTGDHQAPQIIAERSGPPSASGAPTVRRLGADGVDGSGDGTGSHAASTGADAASDYRPQTAQSWQQMLGGERSSRARSAALLAVVGGFILISLMVLVGVMVVGGESQVESSPAAAATEVVAPSTDESDPSTDGVPSAAPEGQILDAGGTAPEATGEPTAEPTTSRRPLPRRPRGPVQRPPQGKPASIFDTRQ